MDEGTNERADEWMVGAFADGRTDGRTERWIDERTERWIDGRTDVSTMIVHTTDHIHRGYVSVQIIAKLSDC